jgi:hypothetical protein
MIKSQQDCDVNYNDHPLPLPLLHDAQPGGRILHSIIIAFTASSSPSAPSCSTLRRFVA